MTDDGGPAFPQPCNLETCEHIGCKGMSLRDWFAGMALSHPYAGDEDTNRDMIAKWTYAVADAMLAHRTAGKEDSSETDE